MNRVLLTAGALLMLVSSAAMAFEDYPNPVRVTTLSGGDSFNSNFILDSNDAYSWFGRIYRNADHVRVTWAPDGDAQGLGFIKSEEGYGAYMLHFQQGYNDYYGPRDYYAEYNHFTLGYGYPFGNFDLGLVYNRQALSANEEDVEETARAEFSESYNTIGAGITYDMDDETAIDASFMFTTGSIDYGNRFDPDEYTDETTGFGGGVRAFKSMREDLTIIPALLFSSSTNTETYKPEVGDEEKLESTAMDIKAGLAFDYTINEDNDLYLFVSYQNMKDEETYTAGNDEEVTTDTWTAMPGIGAAVEHELTDMFTMRIGATKNWMTHETEYPNPANEEETVTNEYKSYPWEFSFGMGIAMGDWVIDLALNQTWLYGAGYWFHGYSENEPPIAQIEAKLWF